MKKRIKLYGLLMIAVLVATIGLRQAQAQEQIKDAPKQVLITNVSVWNVTADKAFPADVLIEGNLVKKVAKGIKATGADIIDGGGRVLLPGLIDTHTHLALVAPFDQLENEYDGVYVGAVAAQMAQNMLMRGSAGVKSIEHGNMMTESSMQKLVNAGAFLSIQASASQSPSPEWFTADQKAKHKLARDGFFKMVELAKKYYAKITFSSDWFGSDEAFALQSQEWIARKDLWTPVEILRQATGTAGDLLALSGQRNPYREGKLGVIEEGAYADLVIVDGNPLEDITLLADPEKNLRLIMKDGKIYKHELK